MIKLTEEEYYQYIHGSKYTNFCRKDGDIYLLNVSEEKWILIRIYVFHMHKWYGKWLDSETPATLMYQINDPIMKKNLYFPIDHDGKAKKMFVRLSSCAPKDLLSSMIVDNWNDAKALISQSKRCLTYIENCPAEEEIYMCLRAPVETDIDRELRCFFYNGKLRAVSSASDGVLPCSVKMRDVKRRVIPFFERIANDIPYHECVVDVTVLEKEKRVMILEFNSWKVRGLDGEYVSSAYNFDWDIDYQILTRAKRPVIRL